MQRRSDGSGMIDKTTRQRFRRRFAQRMDAEALTVLDALDAAYAAIAEVEVICYLWLAAAEREELEATNRPDGDEERTRLLGSAARRRARANLILHLARGGGASDDDDVPDLGPGGEACHEVRADHGVNGRPVARHPD